jgi:hypothetical protein
MVAKTPPIPPLFKADTATLAFSASKDGKVTVTYQGWDDRKVVLEGQGVRGELGVTGGGGAHCGGGQREGGP